MNALETFRQSVVLLLPELLILAASMAMMTAGAFVRAPRRTWAATAAATLGVGLVVLFLVRNQGYDPYGSVAVNDALAWYGRLAFLVTGLLILGLAHDQVDDARAPEFFGALLMAFAGSMLVASANELIFLFLGLELVSLPTYLLLYLPRRNASTLEAATKYFFLSIFSSGLLLFGLTYLYGLAGVSNLRALAYLVQATPGLPHPQLGLIAVVFIIAGLGFRVAAVPFHFYAPDVYEGSPTVMAAFLAWIPKGIGFLAMIRVLGVLGGNSIVANKGVMVAWIVAAATMTLGNTVALAQENLKRLLAYSSIAHAGYMMIGVAAAFRNGPGDSGDFLGAQGIVFYLAAYGVMTIGVFGLIMALGNPDRPVETVDDLAGLGKTHPWAALGLALCLFSLTGIPPLAGFWGKFYVFASAFSAGTGEDAAAFRLLAVIACLNAAIGAYYYLRIVVLIYLRPAPEVPVQPRPSWPTVLTAGTCATLSLLLGLYPLPIARAARQSAAAALELPAPIDLPEATRQAMNGQGLGGGHENGSRIMFGD